RYHFDRLSVEQRGLVFPLLDCIQGGLNQKRMAADNTQVLDSTLFADYGFKHHGTLNSRLLGQRRLGRLDLADQVGLLHVSAYSHSLRWLGSSGRWGGRRRHGGRCPTNHTTDHSADLAARDSTGHTTNHTTDGSLRRRSLVH